MTEALQTKQDNHHLALKIHGEITSKYMTPYFSKKSGKKLYFFTSESNTRQAKNILEKELSALNITDPEILSAIEDLKKSITYAELRHFRKGIIGFIFWVILAIFIFSAAFALHPINGSIVALAFLSWSFFFVQYIPGWKIKDLMIKGRL